MNILKNYFQNYKCLDALKIETRTQKPTTNGELREIEDLYKRSALYEINLDDLLAFNKSYEEGGAVQKINGVSYIDPDYFTQIKLPSAPVYAHFDRPIKFRDAEDNTTPFLIGILISRKIVILFINSIREGYEDYLAPYVLYKNQIFKDKKETVPYTQSESWVTTFPITAIEFILNYKSVSVDRATEPNYQANCKLWNKKKVLPDPIRFYKVTSEIKDQISTASYGILQEYFKWVSALRFDPEYYKHTKLGTYLPKAQLYEIACNKCEDQSIELVDDFDLNDLNLPAPYLYIGFTDRPAIFTADPNKIMLTESMFISKDLIAMTFTFLATGEPGISISYENNKWIIGDTKRDIIRRVRQIVSYINSFQTITVNRLTDRDFDKICKKFNKRNKMRNPPFYYRVGLKKVVTEVASDIPSYNRRECEYAYMVRGHPVYRIGKGSLPIDPDLEQRLKKNPKRFLYLSPKDISSEHLEVLAKRDIEVNEGEWISILEAYRQSHIANSKDGKNPYIPSIHVAT